MRSSIICDAYELALAAARFANHQAATWRTASRLSSVRFVMVVMHSSHIRPSARSTIGKNRVVSKPDCTALGDDPRIASALTGECPAWLRQQERMATAASLCDGLHGYLLFQRVRVSTRSKWGLFSRAK